MWDRMSKLLETALTLSTSITLVLTFLSLIRTGLHCFYSILTDFSITAGDQCVRRP